MEKYKQLNTDELYYILTPTTNKIPKGLLERLLGMHGIGMDMKDWYDEIEEHGCLVKLDSRVGFMFRASESHTSQYSDAEGLKMALAHGKRTVNSVMELMCEAAEIIAEQPCEVYVGNCTGIDKQHELFVFFPYGMDIDIISRTIGIVNGTIKELAFKKWNSLVDVVKYG